MTYNTDYISIIERAYNLEDPSIRRKFLFCNEATKSNNLEHLANRLYGFIKQKVDKIDFGTIPKSKGDITKIDNYQNLMDCIETIRAMVVEYKQPTTIVDQLSVAVDNIIKRKRVFEKAFGMNIEFPMMLYNSTVLSCVSSVSLLITSCIEYVKDGPNTFETAFNKAAYIKSKDHVLYKYIVGFNNICANGSFDKMVSDCIKNNLTVTKEDADLASLAAIGYAAYTIGTIVAKFITGKGLFDNAIFGLRSIVYYFFYMRVNISDWFSIQADFLAVNAENLKYREDRKNSESHKSKVYEKQMKWVERFRKISNFFALKDSKSRKAASENESEDNKHQDDDDYNGNSDDVLF